jgi:hypothetical protein
MSNEQEKPQLMDVEAKKAHLLETYATLGSIVKSCQACHVAQITFRNWLKEDPIYRDMYLKLKADKVKRSTYALQVKFLNAIAKVGTITHAAEISNLSPSNHTTWMKDRGYRIAFERAKLASADVLEREAYRRGVEGYEVDQYQGGEWRKIRKYSDTLLIFLLNGALPEKYKKVIRTEGEVKHEHTHTLDLSKLTDEQLQQLQNIINTTERQALGDGPKQIEAPDRS